MEPARSEYPSESEKVISPFAHSEVAISQNKGSGGKLFLIIGLGLLFVVAGAIAGIFVMRYVNDPYRTLESFPISKYLDGYQALAGSKFKVFVPELVTKTEQKSTQPNDRTKIGIGEEVDCTLFPATLPNPLKILWTNTGSGIFEDTDISGAVTGLAQTYQAYCLAQNDTLNIAFPNGFVLNTTKFNVILPSQYNLSQESGADGYTDYTSMITLGVGFKGWVYFGPDTVNFYNAWWLEEEVPSIATGSLVGSNLDGVGHNPNPNPLPLGTEVRANFGTGGDGGAVDHCGATLDLGTCSLPLSDGSSVEWDIPQKWDWVRHDARAASGITGVFETEPQKAVIHTSTSGTDRVAEMTLSKGDSPDSVQASSSWGRNN